MSYPDKLICTMDRFMFIILRTLGLIILYYSFSIGITFYQKWLINGFHFPLFVVLCHLIIKYLLAALVRFSCRILCGIVRITIPWSVSWKKLAITGIASSLDIGFSNWSFEFITISLYTMTKSSCVIFILFFAIIFKLENLRSSVLLIVVLISSGLFMFTYQSTQFHLTGFTLVLLASVLSGLRWTLAQLVMQRKEIGLSNPIDMIYFIQPWMIASLIPLVIWIEVIPLLRDGLVVYASNLDHESESFVSPSQLVSGGIGDSPAGHVIASSSTGTAGSTYEYLLLTAGYILAGSILAFLMEVSEYLLLTFTSSLTLSIAGIFKEVFTLFLAYEVNGDSMTWINFCGLIVCLIGISSHIAIKVSEASINNELNKHHHRRNEEVEEAALLSTDNRQLPFTLKRIKTERITI